MNVERPLDCSTTPEWGPCVDRALLSSSAIPTWTFFRRRGREDTIPRGREFSMPPVFYQVFNENEIENKIENVTENENEIGTKTETSALRRSL